MLTPPALAQLRVVSYNPTNAPRPGMDIVLKSIGEEARNGIAKPIDVLLLQEQSHNAGLPDTQAFVNLLNNTIYVGQTFNGLPITYARGNTIGSGDDTQTIVYRTQTIDLIAEAAFGTTSGTNPQPRQTLRYRLRPDGYAAAADFYVYNSHYKASDIFDDPNNPLKRNTEAIAIRANSNALGEGTHAIYAGDHNFYDYTAAVEPAFQTLIAAGAGQANDPINRIGTWHNNSSFADVHTQSPTNTAHYTGQVTGGMDDRFDFQLVTGEFLDNEGLSYISGSYHAFGNGGTTCCNGNINDASNTYTFTGVSPMTYTKSQILNALNVVTDHIPVVADYQLPAVLNAVASTAPATLNVGQVFNLDLTVNNAANVLQPIGADELDYSVTTSGDLLGSFFNQTDMALGSQNVHQIQLNTSTPGMKSGLLSVQTASQGAANPLITIPISFQVLAASLYGDYNSDGIVDAADYTLWRDKLGAVETLANEDPAASPGSVTIADYDVWNAHFGQSLSGAGAGAAVPEPGTLVMLLVGICLLRPRLARLKGCTSRN